MTWPVAELDAITRLRAIAAAYPTAGVAETTVDVPFVAAWAWLTDFEHSIPLLDRKVRKIRIRKRDGNRLRMWGWAGASPIPLSFDVTVDDGFCIMAARFRLFLVVMAAKPTADGGTRYMHLEALPLHRVGRPQRLFQRMVESDVRGFRRHVGT